MATHFRRTPIDRNADIRLLIETLEEAITALNNASIRALGLLRAQLDDISARFEDDDDWRRMPKRAGRCPVSGWSRTTLDTLAREGSIRRKKVHNATYYSMKDIRKFLSSDSES